METIVLALDLESLPPWVEDLGRTIIIAVLVIALLVTFSTKTKGKDKD